MNLSDYAIETVYRRQRLSSALGKMNNDYQRLAIVLYLLNYHCREIAEVYHCSRQNIQQIIAEFKRRNGVKELA